VHDQSLLLEVSRFTDIFATTTWGDRSPGDQACRSATAYLADAWQWRRG
jgi:hypothetical protein